MCYKRDEFQAFLDSEVEQQKRWEIELHIAGCETCQNILTDLKLRNETIATVLLKYESTISHTIPDPNTAWQILANRNENDSRRQIFKGVEYFMNKYAKVSAALVGVAVMVLLLSFSSVRASVADFLHIFRVEKVETVTISQQDISELQRAMETGGKNIDIESFGKIDVTGSEELTTVSHQEAIKTVDFDLKIPEAVDGYNAPKFRAKSAMKVDLTLKVDKVNAMIATLGSNKPLPEELDGKTVSVSIPAMVLAEYSDTAGNTVLMVGQSRSPQIAVPDDIDVNKIRDSLLSLSVLPEDLRSKLAAVNDWQHTLLIPSVEGSSQEIKVNGNEGVFMSPPDKQEGHGGALIWPQDGVINVIQGSLTLDQALAIAAQMK